MEGSSQEILPYWKNPIPPPEVMGDKAWSPNTCVNCGESFYTCDSYLRLCPPCEGKLKGLRDQIGKLLKTYMGILKLDRVHTGWTEMEVGAGKRVSFTFKAESYERPPEESWEAKYKELKGRLLELNQKGKDLSEELKCLSRVQS